MQEVPVFLDEVSSPTRDTDIPFHIFLLLQRHVFQYMSRLEVEPEFIGVLIFVCSKYLEPNRVTVQVGRNSELDARLLQK
jgi:hypothetical protein